LIPRETKPPEEEWRSQVAVCRTEREEPQRARGDEAAAVEAGGSALGANQAVGEPKSRTGGENRAGGRWRRIRPGALTPEWQPMRVGCRCGRAKGRCEQAAPVGRKRATSQEALIPVLGKTAQGELRGETSGTFNRGVQGRACRQWAGLGIGSLGTFFFLSRGLHFHQHAAESPFPELHRPNSRSGR